MRKSLPALADLVIAATTVLPALGSSEPGPPLALSFSFVPEATTPRAASGQDTETPPATPPAVQARKGRAAFEMVTLMAYSQTRYLAELCEVHRGLAIPSQLEGPAKALLQLQGLEVRLQRLQPELDPFVRRRALTSSGGRTA